MPARGGSVPRLSPVALVGVLLAHVAVGAGMMAARTPVALPPQAPALMVEVIKPERPEARKPDITPPRPKPVARQERVTRAPEIPVLAAKPATPEPLANEVKQVPPAPLPPIQAPPPPQVNAPVVTAAVPAPVAAPTPPKYDADYLDNPKPIYPPLSKREREQGVVRLRVYVEANGLPSKIEVQASSGFERLDKAAVTAVGRWRFVPARRGNEAVADWVTFPVNFSLKE